MELEVVLAEGERLGRRARGHALMAWLGVEAAWLVEGAYVDLLREKCSVRARLTGALDHRQRRIQIRASGTSSPKPSASTSTNSARFARWRRAVRVPAWRVVRRSFSSASRAPPASGRETTRLHCSVACGWVATNQLAISSSTRPVGAACRR